MARGRFIIGFTLLLCVYLTASVAADPTIAWQPVSSTGPYSLDGNTIIIPGGGTGIEVTLEIKLSGWGSAPGNPELGAWQGTVDPAGYDNGIGDPLNPKGWPTSPDEGAFIDLDREDGICHLPAWLCAVGLLSPAYEYGGTGLAGGATDDGSLYYGGTLILEIPAAAAGDYAIGWDTSSVKTFFCDEFGASIMGLVVVPAVIELPSVTGKCCYGYPWPECADSVTEAACAELAGEPGYFYFPGLSCNDTIPCEYVCNWHPHYCWDWIEDDCRADYCDYDTGECEYAITYDPAVECCDARTGEITPIDAGNDCTDDSCEMRCFNGAEFELPCQADGQCSGLDTCSGTGEQMPLAEGSPCEHGDDCVVNDECDGAGECAGDLPADLSIPCDNDDACPTAWFCNYDTGLCDCLTNPDDARKNRYISIFPDSGGTSVAFQVELTASLYFPESVGVLGWIGEPVAGIDLPELSRVVDTPYYSDAWPAVVHVADCQIVPVATYSVRATPDGSTFGDPVAVSTIRQPVPNMWGDVVGAFTGTKWNPPNKIVNFNDITAAIHSFMYLSTAPPITWVDIQPELPDGYVGFADIQRIVRAFQGEAYPFSAPAGCSK